MKTKFLSRILKTILFSAILAVTITSAEAFAANCYWVGSNSTWESSSNWASAAGGTPGTCTATTPAGYPDGGDDTAYFTTNNTTSASMGGAISLTALNINTGYSGTISTNNYSLSTTGALNLASGNTATFNAGSSTITIGGAFTVAAGTFNTGSSTINAAGAVTLSGGTFAYDTSTINFNGSSAQTLNTQTTQSFYNFIINKSGSTALNTSSGDTITVTNQLTLTDGKLGIYSSGALVFNGSLSNFTYASTFDGANNTSTYTGALELKADQDFTLTTTNTYIPGLKLNNQSFNDFDFTLDAGTDVTIWGAFTMINGAGDTPEFTNLNDSNITFNSTTTVEKGTLNTGSSTSTTFTGTTTLSGGTISADATTTTFTGAVTLSSGTLTLNSTTTNFTASLTISGATFTPNTSKIVFNGSSNQTFDFNSTLSIYALEINKSGNSYLTLLTGDTLTITNSLTLTDGRTSINTNAEIIYTGTSANFSYASTFDGGYNSTSNTGYLTFKPSTYPQAFTINTTNTVLPGIQLYNDGTTQGVDTLSLDLQDSTTKTIYGKFRIYETTPGTGTTFSNSGNGDLTFGGGSAVPFAIESGTFNTGSSTTTTFAGTVTASGGTMNLNSTTTTFTPATTFSGTTINNSSTTLNFSNTLAVSGGEFKAGSNTVNHTGVVTISGTGTYNAESALIYLNGNLTITGGSFTEGTSGVVLTGTANGTLDANSTETFYNLQINKSGTTTNIVTIPSGDTIYVSNILDLNDGRVAIASDARLTFTGTDDNFYYRSTFEGANPSTSYLGYLSFKAATTGQTYVINSTNADLPGLELHNDGLSSMTLDLQNTGTNRIYGKFRIFEENGGTGTIFSNSGNASLTFGVNTSATVSIEGGTFNTGSSTTTTFTGPVTASGGIMNLNSTTTTFTPATTFSGATINNSSTTLNFSSTLALSGGEFKAGSNTVNHTGIVTLSSTGTYSVQSASNTFTNRFVMDGGTFNGGSTTTNFNNTSANSIDINGGTFNAGTGSLIIASTGGFDMDGGTFNGSTTNGTLQIGGAFDHSTAGTFNAENQLVKVGTSFTIGSGATFNEDESTIEFTGTGSYSVNVNSSETFYNIRINKGSDTAYQTFGSSDIITISNGLELLNGKINVEYASTLNAYVSGSTFIYDEDFDGGYSAYLVNLFPNYDNVTIEIPEILNATKTIPAFTLNSNSKSNFTLNYTGTSALTFPYPFKIVSGSSTKFDATQNADLTFSSTLEISAGNFYTGTGTIQHNGAITINGGTYNNEGSNTIASTLTISSGEYKAGTGTQDISNTLTLSGTGIFNVESSTTTFSAALTISGGTYKGGTGTANHNEDITVSGGTFDLESGDLNLGTYAQLTNTSGTFTATNGNIDSNYYDPANPSLSAIYINGGTFNAPGTGKTFTILKNFTHTSGTFNHNDGKITFDGPNSITLDIPTSDTFGDIEINKSSDDAIVTISSSDTYTITGYLILNNGKLDIPTNSTFIIDTTGDLAYSSNFDGRSTIGGGYIRLTNSGTVTLPNGATQIPGLYLNNSSLIVETDTATLPTTFYGPLYIAQGSFENNGDAEITFESTVTILNGTLDAKDGSFDHKTDFTISNSNSTYNAGSGSIFFEGDLTISSGTYNASNASITIENDFDLNGGTFIAPGTGEYLAIGEDFNVGSSGTFNHNNGKVILYGGYTTSITDFSTNPEISFYDLEIDKPQEVDAPPSVLQVQQDLIINNSFTLIDGYLHQGFVCDNSRTEPYDADLCMITVEATGSVSWGSDFDGGYGGYIKMNNAQTLNIPEIPYYFTYGDVPSLWLNNDSLLVQQTSAGNVVMSNLLIEKGTFSNTGNGDLSLGQFTQLGGTFNGGNSDATLSFDSAAAYYPGVKLDAGTFNANAGDCYMRWFEQNGGTFNAGSSTLRFENSSYDGFNLKAGTFNSSTNPIHINSEWHHTGGTYSQDATHGAIIFDGTYGFSSMENTTTQEYLNVTINKTDSTDKVYIKTGALRVKDLSITSGTLDTKYPLETEQEIIITGNWTLADTNASFIPNTSTVSFDGDTQSIYGANTFYNLSKPHNSTLSFEPGVDNKTIVNGTWTMQGTDADHLLLLRSTSPGTQWYIEINGDYDIAYLDVQDSNSTYEIDAQGTGSIPEGSAPNNFNWLFDVTGGSTIVTQRSPSGQTGDTTPTFTWDDINGETSYTIQVRNLSDMDWSDPVLEITNIPADTTSIAAPTALGYNTYTWRIYSDISDPAEATTKNFQIINLVPEFNTYLYILILLGGIFFIYRQKRQID
ncbi:MAG: hypothetical protein RBS56_01550 [Candidatus Gracilibacteria bacterium]|jgi:hypothetical protein|nr:hypothetical protein [Candidatus Gracilibacteria bacterium]